jgi:hypothetical protein
MQDIGQWLVIMLAINSFLACYFSLKLLKRFFYFEFGMAGVAAVLFAFSNHTVSAVGEPDFLFSVAVLPWAAYAALAFEERPGVPKLLVGCIPVIMAILGGYVPLALASMALAAVLVAAKLVLLDDTASPLVVRFKRLVTAMAPFVLASLILAPYLASLYVFFKDSPSVKALSLFYSAHQLADLPQTLMRILSFDYIVPGPIYEFSVTWGLAAVTVTALFLFSPKVSREASSREWSILKIVGIIYFATVLAVSRQTEKG